MKKKELKPEQVTAVPCSTCGVPTAERCVLRSGAARSEPHVDRKLSAIDAIQREWIGKTLQLWSASHSARIGSFSISSCVNRLPDLWVAEVGTLPYLQGLFFDGMSGFAADSLASFVDRHLP